MGSSNHELPSVKLPQVAVIIANHNYAQWLPQAIASAVEQDYPLKEIIVVDDGSTDDSLEILRQLCPDKENNTFIGHIGDTKIIAYGDFDNRGYPALGPAAARNKAIKNHTKDNQLFAILDADDYWAKDKLSKSVAQFMMNAENLGAVYTDNYSLNVRNGNILREYRESFDINRLLEHNMVHSGCVISKQALEQVGLYDEEMRVAEDYDLWIRIAEKFLILHIPEPLVTIRVGSHNTGNSISKEIWNHNWQRISQKIQERNNATRNNH
jgi:glycosyltransferase involved in cell wall biosynthesis